MRRSDLPFNEEIAALRYATFAMTINKVSSCLSSAKRAVVLLSNDILNYDVWQKTGYFSGSKITTTYYSSFECP